MKEPKLIILILISILQSHYLIAQTVLNGNVMDSSNNQSLIGASIRVAESNVSTITNEEGMFRMQVDKLPAVLIFSHIGYKTLTKEIASSNIGEVKLQSEPILLPEVTVNNSAISLLNAVVDKALEDTTNKYFDAFYRSVSTNDGKFRRIQEMFFNVSWNIFGISGWQPLNIRTVVDNPQFRSNFLILGFKHSGIVAKLGDAPINSVNIGNGFVYKIKHYINAGIGKEIAVISFVSKKNKSARYKGDIYVDTQSYSLLRFTENIDLKNGKFKRSVKIDALFEEDKDGRTHCRNIYINEQSGKQLSFKMSDEKIWIYFLHKIKGFNNTNTVYPPFFKSYEKILTDIPYNGRYWQREVPISHTDLVNKAVKELGKNGKFKGSFN